MSKFSEIFTKEARSILNKFTIDEEVRFEIDDFYNYKNDEDDCKFDLRQEDFIQQYFEDTMADDDNNDFKNSRPVQLIIPGWKKLILKVQLLLADFKT